MKTLFKFLMLAMILMISAANVQSSNDPPPDFQTVQFAQADLPSTTVTDNAVKPEPEVQIATPGDSVSNASGSWVDPSQLPPKDPAGIFGVGWEWLMAVLYGLISLVIYFYPTANKWKWLTWLFDLVAFFFPNRKKGGGSHNSTLWKVLKGDY